MRGLRTYFAAGLVLALSACAGAGDDPLTGLARERAIASTEKVLKEEFPLLPADVAAPCIVDNTSAKQLLVLAGASVTKDYDSATKVVSELVEKPAFQQCIGDGLLDKLF